MTEMKDVQAAKNVRKVVMKPNGFTTSKYLALSVTILCASLLLNSGCEESYDLTEDSCSSSSYFGNCGKITKTEQYGLTIKWTSTYYFVRLESVPCSSCSQKDLKGQCKAYLRYDGKVVALYGTESNWFLDLETLINQTLYSTYCEVDTIYMVPVRFLSQPVEGSFDGAVFTVNEGEIEECGSNCYESEVTITQEKLEQHHAKKNVLLVSSKGEAMQLIRELYNVNDDLKVTKKNKSETPLFIGGLNNLTPLENITNDIKTTCDGTSTKFATESAKTATIKLEITQIESELVELNHSHSEYESRKISLEDELAKLEQENGPVDQLTERVAELKAQIAETKARGKNYSNWLIGVSVALGLVIAGLAVFALVSVLKCCGSEQVQIV